jgi:preprotein translocase subunit SecB
MKETSKAAFVLEYYKVSKFNFIESDDDAGSLNVKFQPSGKYSLKDGKFTLTFNFFATYGEIETELISITMAAFFKFEEPIEFTEIPDYFYRNSIAIVFPYLRAFISTLTSVANSKPLILPVMNLSSLEEPLKKNTISE